MIQRRRQQNDLLVLAVRVVLLLPQQAHQALPVVQLALGGVVQIAGELHKHLHLAVLGQIKAQRAGGLLHGLCLGRAAHTGYGQAHVDRRALSGME